MKEKVKQGKRSTYTLGLVYDPCKQVMRIKRPIFTTVMTISIKLCWIAKGTIFPYLFLYTCGRSWCSQSSALRQAWPRPWTVEWPPLRFPTEGAGAGHRQTKELNREHRRSCFWGQHRSWKDEMIDVTLEYNINVSRSTSSTRNYPLFI